MGMLFFLQRQVRAVRTQHLGALAVVAILVATVAPGWLPAQDDFPMVARDGGLSVVTLNIAMEVNPETILREWERTPAIRNADVFLLQEVIHFGGDRPNVAEKLAEKLRYHIVYAPEGRLPVINGLAIVSRYPLKDPWIRSLKTFNLHVRSRSRLALAATVQSPHGDIRVFNVHLDTRINGSDRVEQLRPVVDEALQFDGPALIGGDFNTNNNRWIGHLIPLPFAHIQTRAVQDLMLSSGFTTPFSGPTHDFLSMRLDWVFLRGLQPKAHGIQQMRFSDHHALWTQLAPSRSLPPVARTVD